MFCQKCGQENPDEARFCGTCGVTCEPVRTETPPDPVTKVITPQSDGNSVSDGLKYGVLGGSLLLPLIGLVMGLIYLFGEGNEDKKAVGKLWLYVSIGLSCFYIIASDSGF